MSWKKTETAHANMQCSNLQEPLVVIDARQDANPMPAQFRTTNDVFKPPLGRKVLKQHGRLPDRAGLERLNLSASAQFSRQNLENMIKILGPNFYIVDLRQESHGFAGGSAVSLYAPQNAINRGFSLKEMREREQAFLQKLSVEKPTYLCQILDKDNGQICEEEKVEGIFSPVSSEESLAKEMGLRYVRFETPDHARPADDVVDRFVDFVKTLPPKSAIHVHCRAGKGRTTQFSALYDMLHNADQVSFDDIITRQYLIGGSPLMEISQKREASWKKDMSEKRLAFLREFYEYAKSPQGYGHITWSQWQRIKAPRS